MIEFSLNKASELEIVNHLLCCDAEFVSALSDRVDISAYAKKITSKAVRIEAWSEDALIGLLAVYCNNMERRYGYITSISLLREWTRKGIASQLIEKCKKYVREIGFNRIELEVNCENVDATKLYVKNGFKVKKMIGRVTIMYLNNEMRT